MFGMSLYLFTRTKDEGNWTKIASYKASTIADLFADLDGKLSANGLIRTKTYREVVDDYYFSINCEDVQSGAEVLVDVAFQDLRDVPPPMGYLIKTELTRVGEVKNKHDKIV